MNIYNSEMGQVIKAAGIGPEPLSRSERRKKEGKTQKPKPRR
jgi:hypothetical protein